MGVGTYARYAVGGVVVVLLLALLVGQLLGQPLLLTYVQTDSMSPTIEPGDGYIVLPSSVAGGVSEGDIVLYEAQNFDGGGLTTHRVVDDTGEGYITKGDNNPFTDQDGGEPPVAGGQVVGVALQVGGGPVIVPWLGVLVTTVQGVVAAVVGTVLGVVGLDTEAGAGTVGVVAIVAGLLMLLGGEPRRGVRCRPAGGDPRAPVHRPEQRARADARGRRAREQRDCGRPATALGAVPGGDLDRGRGAGPRDVRDVHPLRQRTPVSRYPAGLVDRRATPDTPAGGAWRD